VEFSTGCPIDNFFGERRLAPTAQEAHGATGPQLPRLLRRDLVHERPAIMAERINRLGKVARRSEHGITGHATKREEWAAKGAPVGPPPSTTNSRALMYDDGYCCKDDDRHIWRLQRNASPVNKGEARDRK